jgi:hypothetical protein
MVNANKKPKVVIIGTFIARNPMEKARLCSRDSHRWRSQERALEALRLQPVSQKLDAMSRS